MKEQTPITIKLKTMKEQTPIEIVESLKGKNEIEQAVIILSFTNAKVLEALEREFGKLIDLKPNRTHTALMDAKKYYETEVKPRYEREA
jgi:hypothetical protein